MTLKNIIFDFDGTLGDSEKVGMAATKEAFTAYGLTAPSTETIGHYMGIPIEISFKEMADRELTDAEFTGMLAEFRKRYQTYEKDYLRSFPGTGEMLKRLAEANLQLFVASSKHGESLKRNLEILGIAHFFKDVVGSDMVTNYKPHPESIDVLLDKYDLDKNETVMVGDAIFDLQMGKAAGVKTCAVTWGSHAEEKLRAESPDFVAHDNAELTKILLEN
ncbi:MAG: HAD family hydrolase [Streptococcaceae bacterium]|jgi:HAD superfamily hydrolase (TIGR01549 family)|nr:HAD family hydrolase [Streptococcaceae bacterium]